MRRVHLGRELSKDASEHNTGESNVEEDELDSIRKSKHINTGIERGGALVDDEHDEKHHKLTTHQISVQVVALECKCCVLVSDRVAVFVKIGVNWGQTD